MQKKVSDAAEWFSVWVMPLRTQEMISNQGAAILIHVEVKTVSDCGALLLSADLIMLVLALLQQVVLATLPTIILQNACQNQGSLI